MDENDIIQSPSSTKHVWADPHLIIMIQAYGVMFIIILCVTGKLITEQSLCYSSVIQKYVLNRAISSYSPYNNSTKEHKVQC